MAKRESTADQGADETAAKALTGLSSDALESRIQALTAFVEERPLAVVVAAGAMGVALGGLVLSRVGRLAFAAAVGYVASDLWRRQGGRDIDEVLHDILG